MTIIGHKFILKPEDGEGFPDFIKNLPRHGIITGQRESTDGNCDWYILEFDEPFEYQKEHNNPKRWELITVSKVLVRSRWQGYPIGGEETSVFILVPPHEEMLSNQVVDIRDYYFDARGMIEKE